jgi:imidazole glycerol-phosphate synthase subunit HisH
MTERRVAFAATGVANLASIQAAFRRAGAVPFLAARADELAEAAFAVVPGVGSFGSAMAALRASGMDEAVKDRITRHAPTAGVCVGMQLFFEGSEESPGAVGLGLLPGTLRRFPSDLPVPQLGWNMVTPIDKHSPNGAELISARQEIGSESAPDFAERSSARGSRSESPRLVREGWAYFANSYRMTEAPEGYAASLSVYGESFVAALEGDGLLLCQFHPELSGPWGLELIRSWLGSPASGKGSEL